MLINQLGTCKRRRWVVYEQGFCCNNIPQCVDLSMYQSPLCFFWFLKDAIKFHWITKFTSKLDFNLALNKPGPIRLIFKGSRFQNVNFIFIFPISVLIRLGSISSWYFYLSRSILKYVIYVLYLYICTIIFFLKVAKLLTA